MGRAEFITALKSNQFGDFVAMYRPFWNTGGEMGNWDDELMYTINHSFTTARSMQRTRSHGATELDVKVLQCIVANTLPLCTSSLERD